MQCQATPTPPGDGKRDLTNREISELLVSEHFAGLDCRDKLGQVQKLCDAKAGNSAILK